MEQRLLAPILQPNGQAVCTGSTETGKEWTIQASPLSLLISSGSEHYELPREQWASAIRFSPTGSNVVVHIDLGDREIGFMVSTEEARFLFSNMAPAGSEGRGAASIEPARRVQQARPAAVASPAGGSLWPKMTAMPIWALSFSVLSFFPYAGLLFGIGALILAVATIRRSWENAAYTHVRIMAKVSIVITICGLIICALGMYTVSSPVVTETVIGESSTVGWNPGSIAAAIIMVLLALSFHEAAHAISALWCGDDYARSLGRVTLNPLAHMDPFGTFLLPLMLAIFQGPIFGYAKPVPVRLGTSPRYHRAQILVSIAGPGSNLLQAAICLGLFLCIGCLLNFGPAGMEVGNFSTPGSAIEITGISGGKVIAALALLFKFGFQVNVFLAFFNLIPIPPLDGSWVLQFMFPNSIGKVVGALRSYGILVFLFLIYTGAFGILLYPAYIVTGLGYAMVSVVTGF